MALEYKPTFKKKLSFALLFADLIGLYSTRFLVYFLWVPSFEISFLSLAWFFINFIWVDFTILIFLYIYDLYKVNHQISGLRSPPRTFVALASAGLLVILFNVAIKSLSSILDPIFLPISTKILAANIGLLTIWASLTRFFVSKWFLKRVGKINWLVLDENGTFLKIYNEFLKKHPNQSFHLLTNLKNDDLNNDSIHKLGAWEDLENVSLQKWSGIVLASRKQMSESLIEKLMNIRLEGTRVYNLSQFYEEFLYKIPVVHLNRSWFTLSQGFNLLHNPLGLRLKRVVDFFFSTIFLILTTPLMLLIALMVKLTSRGPALFKQARTGEFEKEFLVYKFRTMVHDAEKHGAQWAKQNDPRVTKLGKFLRASRLDELPQLWNVFKGDMSFIGPRPERPVFNKELEKAIPFYDLRHLVKPGITGWAQVLYPYGASIEDAKEKLEYDLYYIKNYSLFLDIAIVFKTIRVMLLGKGR